ncbi:MAG TPA: hypothetical protein VNN22_16355 [Verrucomicrobiae bacterium]|nr:hypothetical protein [Verrucomicrobiae bacterium]
MSLINDALKRAQEAQRPNPVSGAASIRTIEPRRPERPVTSRLLVVVIFVLLSAAFAFIGLAMTGRLAKKNAAPPKTAPVTPVAAATAPSKPVAAPAPAVVPAPTAAEPVAAAPNAAVPIAITPAAASQPAPPPAPVVVPPPPPLVLPESLHLQGVAYDPVRPWAIVSGRTVHVGDLVKGVRVVAINANSVTFGSNGQTNLLYVGD